MGCRQEKVGQVGGKTLPSPRAIHQPNVSWRSSCSPPCYLHRTLEASESHERVSSTQTLICSIITLCAGLRKVCTDVPTVVHFVVVPQTQYGTEVAWRAQGDFTFSAEA
ncbi:hypothetical protein KIL84_010991 [Mauremys mutica]|uniref:Uncharacterized protein n=1 Tax=Mauremys mutica TaxID=74926 RepID=A0A9D3XB57_9SAUR|nr:hypothetical protein KIL84_010991 [Mauremys mutica]